jgi:nucleotide-binding universal stress UspA family protein
MERGLVVVEDTDAHETLLREAGELAAGTGADLVLLVLTSPDAIDDSREAFADTEGISVVEEAVREDTEFAEAVAGEVLADLDVEHETIASVVEDRERADEAIGVANRRDCDHLFVVGRKRSPTGKAIFGDVAQSIILNFDGPVTTRAA